MLVKMLIHSHGADLITGNRCLFLVFVSQSVTCCIIESISISWISIEIMIKDSDLEG